MGLDPKLLGVRGKKCPLPAFPVGGIRCFVYFVLSPHLSLHMIRFVNTFPPSFHRFFQHPLGFCRFQLELFQSLGVKKRVERKKEKTFFFSKESFQIWLERQRCVPTEVYLKEKKKRFRLHVEKLIDRFGLSLFGFLQEMGDIIEGISSLWFSLADNWRGKSSDGDRAWKEDVQMNRASLPPKDSLSLVHHHDVYSSSWELYSDANRIIGRLAFSIGEGTE